MEIKSLKYILSLKIFLIENECKTPLGCLTFIFYQKYFSDTMDLTLFHVKIFSI